MSWDLFTLRYLYELRDFHTTSFNVLINSEISVFSSSLYAHNISTIFPLLRGIDKSSSYPLLSYESFLTLACTNLIIISSWLEPFDLYDLSNPYIFHGLSIFHISEKSYTINHTSARILLQTIMFILNCNIYWWPSSHIIDLWYEYTQCLSKK